MTLMPQAKVNPLVPQLLGYSGLLPMLACLGGIWLWPHLTDQLTYIAAIYVGVIFSFLGGIQWGMTVHADATTTPDAGAIRLIIGVTPALITLCALVVPTLYGSALLILGLWLLLGFEWRYRKVLVLPAWYIPLRINLTILLSGSLAAVLWLTA
jgi:hypothetical protein